MTENTPILHATRRQARRLWRWWSAPFRTRSFVYKSTKVTYRVFPHRLHVQAVLSTQDRIDGTPDGGWVSGHDCEELILQPIDVSGRSLALTGLHLRSLNACTAVHIGSTEAHDGE